MGAAAGIDPPKQIAACSYCANSICKRPMKLWRSEVILTMLWGVQSSQQVIVKESQESQERVGIFDIIIYLEDMT
eukprot:scaffold43076_cov136-Cyclotella_meneghiniana.AAC.2